MPWIWSFAKTYVGRMRQKNNASSNQMANDQKLKQFAREVLVKIGVEIHVWK